MAVETSLSKNNLILPSGSWSGAITFITLYTLDSSFWNLNWSPGSTVNINCVLLNPELGIGSCFKKL